MRPAVFVGLFFSWLVIAGCSGGDPGAVTQRPRANNDTKKGTETPASNETPPTDTPPTPPPPPAASPTCILCVQAGGNGFAGSGGRTFAADMGSTGGEIYTALTAQAGTDEDALYQNERFGETFSYSFGVANGSYTLKLHFSEIYWTQIGERVFHVDVQDQRVLTDFDILKEAGGANTAIVKSFPVTIANGLLNITFTKAVDAAKVSAIELVKAP